MKPFGLNYFSLIHQVYNICLVNTAVKVLVGTGGNLISKSSSNELIQ